MTILDDAASLPPRPLPPSGSPGLCHHCGSRVWSVESLEGDELHCTTCSAIARWDRDHWEQVPRPRVAAPAAREPHRGRMREVWQIWPTKQDNLRVGRRGQVRER
jgi:hypothetical protein